MTWTSLHAVQLTTRLEFTTALASAHNFVRLLSGRWTRVLGAPNASCVHVHGRIWHWHVREE